MYTAPNELSLVIFIPESVAATTQGMWSEGSSSLVNSSAFNLEQCLLINGFGAF